MKKLRNTRQPPDSASLRIVLKMRGVDSVQRLAEKERPVPTCLSIFGRAMLTVLHSCYARIRMCVQYGTRPVTSLHVTYRRVDACSDGHFWPPGRVRARRKHVLSRRLAVPQAALRGISPRPFVQQLLAVPVSRVSPPPHHALPRQLASWWLRGFSSASAGTVPSHPSTHCATAVWGSHERPQKRDEEERGRAFCSLARANTAAGIAWWRERDQTALSAGRRKTPTHTSLQFASHDCRKGAHQVTELGTSLHPTRTKKKRKEGL